MQELQADVARRQRVARNVALLEQEEASQTSRPSRMMGESPNMQQLDEPQSPPVNGVLPKQSSSTKSKPSPWKAMEPGSDEPQSWSPRTVNRQGS
jgi:hypothetical protein